MAPRKLAFLGATGGCANAALVLALHAGHACSALARTPPKLQAMLSEAGITSDLMAAQLRIVAGDVRDVSAVASTVAGADAIVSGIGIPRSFDIDVKICHKAVRAVGAALRQLRSRSDAAPSMPFLVVISSVGLPHGGPRDVPLSMVPVMRTMLRGVLADKLVMERRVGELANGPERVLRGYTVVRPTWLHSGDENDPRSVKVGDEHKPALGHWINRKDVGRWIFDHVIDGQEGIWNGRRVTLTM